MSSGLIPVWRKRMNQSEAMRQTRGAPMPFLRFTRGNLHEDHATFFRETLFGDAPWRRTTSRQGHAVEEAFIGVHVIIDGRDLGTRRMQLNHDPQRAINHSAPTTHLLYDDATRQVLESTDMTGRPARVWRDSQGDYHMTIG